MSAHRLRAAALALVIAAPAFAPSVVRAAPQDETRAIFSAHTQAGPVVASKSDGHLARPSLISRTRLVAGNAFAESTMNANLFTAAPDSTAIVLQASQASGLAVLGHAGTADMLALAQASLQDQLTLSGAPGDGRAVRLLGQFRLSDEVTHHPGFELLPGDGSLLDFDATGSSQLIVSGDGIVPLADGGGVFARQDFTADASGVVATARAAPQFVDLDLAFTLGQARDFHLSLVDFGQITIDDRAGNLRAQARVGDIAQLVWTGGFQVVDAATGARVCGLTLTSQTGVNFGAESGCGGGGGSGGAGAPEPSAWALMIAGFGLAGAALRRRPRRLCA